MAGGENVPSIADIIAKGYPPEYLPIIIMSWMFFIFVMALTIWNLIKHKKYSTKFPLQFLCNMGILFVYPIFSLSQTTSILVPKFHEISLFLAEAYEALTFLFFLRLVLTFMGGKKSHKETLKGDHVHLNVFPICCFVCLPSIKYTRKYFHFNEALIVISSCYTIVLGYVNLVLTTDKSQAFPASMVEQKYSLFFHITSFWMLVLAVYGLSGIYHSAEGLLKHRNIVKKFLVYKVYVTIVKLQMVIVAAIAHHEGFGHGFDYNELFPTAFRARMINSFFVVAEGAVFLPLAIWIYPISDYKSDDEIVLQNKEEDSEDPKKNGKEITV